MNHKDYYTRTTREMMRAAKEIGGMPFLLFQYYLTYQSASEGIKPSTKQTADDLGIEPNAVCNLRSKLVKAGWISYTDGEIFILKTFTKNECYSQKMNDSDSEHSQKMNKDSQNVNNHSQKMNVYSQKMNKTFTKNESHIRKENKDLEIREKEGEEGAARPRPEAEAEAAPINPALTTSSTSKIILGGAARRMGSDEAAAYLDRPFEFSDEAPTEAERIYREFYPTTLLTGAQQSAFAEIADLNAEVWRDVLRTWQRDNYRAQSIGSMVDRYKNELARRSRPQNNQANNGASTTRWHHDLSQLKAFQRRTV